MTSNFSRSMPEGFADIHIHTDDDDGKLSIAKVIDRALELELSAVAITCHDNVVPSLKARELAAKRRLDLEVFTGAEITLKGLRHLLALNIEENLPFGLPLFEAIIRIHEQGGLVIATHPLVWYWPASLKAKEILSIRDCQDPDIYFDGFEVLNGSRGNRGVQQFYDKNLANDCAQTGGSDAHFNIGKAVTVYPLKIGLVAAIKERRTGVRDCHREDKLTLVDIVRNQYRSMIKEPIRRWRRYGRII